MAATGLMGGESLLSKLKQIFDGLQKTDSVDVGFLEGNTYPDGLPVAQAAFWSEYGTTTAPPRPFFRPAVDEAKKVLGAKAGSIAKAAQYDANLILARMGEFMSGEIQQAIIAVDAPPLSQLTLAIRQYRGAMGDKPITGAIIGQLAAQLKDGTLDVSGVSTKPLVYTGTMLRYIGYEVKNKQPVYPFGGAS